MRGSAVYAISADFHQSRWRLVLYLTSNVFGLIINLMWSVIALCTTRSDR